jgi:hypothetical protein
MDRIIRELTAEAPRTQSEEFSIIKCSELRDLCVSVVKTIFASLVAALPRLVKLILAVKRRET